MKWSNEAASRGMYDDRAWPARMELATTLGAFQPGDRVMVDRLLHHVHEDIAIDQDIIAFHAAVMLDKVPEALILYPRIVGEL